MVNGIMRNISQRGPFANPSVGNAAHFDGGKYGLADGSVFEQCFGGATEWS